MSVWRQRLVKSLYQTRSTPESRYFQLATQSPDGKLYNRTVVCRGLDENRDALWLITDTRSQKWQDLQHNPHAAVCWYIAKTREQYRFTVRCALLTMESDETVCKQHWERLSEPARAQFLWGKPGELRTNPEQALVAEQTATDKPPSQFGVVRLDISNVDYLSLKGNPQTRERYRLDGEQWQLETIIP